MPDHDLLVGGFPCQDHSIAKKGAIGIKGSKGVLWWEIDAIVKAKRPRYILLENVDRLLRSPGKQYGRDFSIILRCLYENGYAAEWRVINAADHGQAQRRRRTFIVVYRNDTKAFKILAEKTCICGLKGMHQWSMEESILAQAFPLAGHTKSWTESWIDELQYADIKALFKKLYQ